MDLDPKHRGKVEKRWGDPKHKKLKLLTLTDKSPDLISLLCPPPTEREGKQKMERKDDDVDRLTELPNSVLLHIMEFMEMKSAVQTSILSTRWKDLWKTLSILTFDSNHFRSLPLFSKFVSSVLSCRDDSILLHKLDLCDKSIGPNLLNRILTYAASHDVQQLLINVNFSYPKDFELPSSLFYCSSLTSLHLSFDYPPNPSSKIRIPKSLELPALKSLHMKNVTFATTDNGCAEPFSTCHMLNTLFIEDCYLLSDAKVFCISNSKLFSLTLSYRPCPRNDNSYEITLSTPNLNLLNIEGDLALHRLSSTCNITCLEEANLHLNYNGEIVISLLQVLAYVKIMTLSRTSFVKLYAILSRASIRNQLPCFIRLKALKLHSSTLDGEVSRTVQYLLQNSPSTTIDIIKC